MKKISGDLSCQKQNKTQLFKGGANLLRSFIYLTHFTHTHTQHHHHQFRKLQLQNFLFDQVTRKWTVPDNQVVVQLLSCVWLFATPWTAASQASLSFTISWSLLKLNVRWVGDSIQLSHPLSSPSPPAFNLSQHQVLFQWVSSLHQVAKVLEFWLQHQYF